MAHLHKGGMQRAVSNITKALSPSLDVHVAFFGSENPGYFFEANVHDLAVPPSRGLTVLRRLGNFVRRVLKLKRLVDTQEIDTLISFGEIANVYNLLTPHGAHKVISIRVDIPSQLAEFGAAKRIIEWFICRLYSRARTIVCVSRHLENYVKRRVRGVETKTSTIYNLYPIQDIVTLSKQPLPEQYRQLEQCKYLLGVGSLVRQKGFDILIRAFAALRDRNVRLVLVGSGTELAALVGLADSLNVKDRVLFIDHDLNPYRYMSRAAVFVLPSRYEGFPNVLVEAMTSGAAVVAFDCPSGPREILGISEWGKLVPQGVETLLTAAIEELLENQAMRARFRQLAAERALAFSSDTIGKQWDKICGVN
jgi:glycosyltransferase involved in cell wall biosynthesis